MITYHYFKIFQLFLFPALGGLLFGYDIGTASYIVPFLHQFYSTVLVGLVTSFPLIGATMTSIFIILYKKASRKEELLYAAVFYIVGALFQYSSIRQPLLIYLLFFGKFFYGIGIGFAMHSAPIYIAEMSPPHIRGLLISAKETFIVFGILLGYIVGYLIQDYIQYLFLSSIVFSITMLIGLMFIPESTRWLLFQNNYDAAYQSLYFYCKQDHEQLFDIIINNQSNSESLPNAQREATLWKPYMIVLVIILFQQITGQTSVLYYIQEIVNNPLVPIYIGILKLVATTLTALLVDRFGRRQLLLTGIFIMLLSLVMLSIFYAFLWNQTAFIVVLLCMYIIGYQIGFGPIAWILVSELFPLNNRAEAVSLAISLNFSTMFLITFVFPLELAYLKEFGTFTLFAILEFLAFLFVYFSLPETRGLSLEAIESLF